MVFWHAFRQPQNPVESENFKRNFFPAPPGTTPSARERPRGRLGGREPLAQVAAEAAREAKTGSNVWERCNGMVSTLWHTRRRGGGAERPGNSRDNHDYYQTLRIIEP
jgi:hypothetical protein